MMAGLALFMQFQRTASFLAVRPSLHCMKSPGIIALSVQCRLDNLVVDPRAAGHVLAVLDWELCTLGHPFADLAYSAMPYHLPAGIEALPSLPHPLPPGAHLFPFIPWPAIGPDAGFTCGEEAFNSVHIPCPRLIGSCLDLASPSRGRILAAFTAACLQTHLASGRKSV